MRRYVFAYTGILSVLGAIHLGRFFFVTGSLVEQAAAVTLFVFSLPGWVWLVHHDSR